MGPEALAKAMFLVESAGYHGAQGLIVMKAAAEGAKIGGAEATVVADGLTTAMKDYNIPTSQAAAVTSKLIATVSAGKTNMGDLSEAMSSILPTAAGLKVSFNDIMGAMATMTGRGIAAADASTMLRFTMMSMANETPKGRKALKSIGMTAQQLKDDLSAHGVGGALQILTEAIGKKFPAGSVAATAAMAAIVGGTRGMGSALALTGASSKDLTANIKSISKAIPEADGHVKGWAETQKDFNTKMSQAKAAVEALGVKIGLVLIPIITSVVEWTTKHSTATKAIAIAIGVATVAAVVWSAALKVISGATKAWAAVQWLMNAALTANPIGLVIVAIGALVAGIVWVATKTTWFQTIWKYMTAAIGASWKWLWNNILQPVIVFILNGFAMVTAAIGHVLVALGNIPGFGWAKTAGEFMLKAANQAQHLANNLQKIKDKTVDVTVNYHTTGSASAADHAITGHARGTNFFRGGMTWVGEEGPELVQLPRGSAIYSNGNSMAMANGGGGSGSAGAAQPLVVQLMLDGRVLHQSLLKLRRTSGAGLALG